MYALFDLAK